VQKTGAPILMSYMTCFCASSGLLGRRDDCSCVKIFSGVNLWKSS